MYALKYPELHNPFLESLVAHTPAVIYQYVLHGNGSSEFVYVSDYVREIFELEPAAIEQNQELIWKRVHPDDRQSCREAMTAVALERGPYHWEGRIVTPKAGIKWIQITVKSQKQPNRDIVCYGLITDISDSKRAAAAQMEREQRFRAMFEQADVGIVEYTLDGRVQQVNQKFCDIVGYSQSELKALSYTDITHSDDRAADDAYLRQLFAGEIQTYSIEKRYLRKGATGEKEVTWVHMRVSLVRRPTGEPQSLLAVVSDISARKKAARALKESERRFRAIFNSAFGFITILSPQGKIEQANQTVLDFAGVQLADMVNSPLWETPWWKASPQHQKRLQQAIATAAAGEFVRYEAEILGTDEKIVTIDFSLKPVFDSCGKVVLLIAEGRDITERKRAEEARRRSGELLKKKNKQLSETLGDLKRTQLQLIQAEKMSSLGQMVAGVAHEINNPVNFIYGNLTHAEDYIKDLLEIIGLYERHYPQPHPEIAAEIEKIEIDFVTEDLPNLLKSMKVGAERIREIVKSMRTFSRLDEAEVKNIDLHDGIDSTLMILHNRLKAQPSHPGIEVVKNYGNLPEVECYAGQLNQVFMNILANAIDALEDCRHGAAACSRENIRNPQIAIRTVRSGDRVEIRIADNGPGMPESVKQRLFDPFFTTKPVGKGTGLGLSISYQIVVDKHGGQMQCFSTPGVGTEFVIDIPIKQS